MGRQAEVTLQVRQLYRAGGLTFAFLCDRAPRALYWVLQPVKGCSFGKYLVRHHFTYWASAITIVYAHLSRSMGEQCAS